MLNFLIKVGLVVYFFLPYFFKTFSYFLIFALLFSQGIFELLSLNGAYAKYAAELLIVSTFVKNILKSLTFGIHFKFVGIKYFILLFLTIIVSSIFNHTSILKVLLFTKIIFIYYILFLSLINDNFKPKELSYFFTLFISLFFIQLIASFVKFFLIGISESGGIGTLSLNAGSISTILPMFASAYLIAAYIYEKKAIYILLIVCFVIFSFIGEKRAIVFYIPLVFFIVQIIYSTRKTTLIKLATQKRFISNLAKFSFLSIIIGYSLVRLSPTLNPDRSIGGKFDLNYLLEYTQEYITMRSVNDRDMLGRAVAPSLTYETVYKYGLIHVLIGLGPGDIIKSAFIPENDNRLLDQYGIGYGGRTGLIWLFMQVGLLGTFLFFGIPFSIYRRINKIFCNTSSYNLKLMSLGFLGTVYVYFIDLISYSSTMIHEGALLSVFYAMPALIIQYEKVNTSK